MNQTERIHYLFERYDRQLATAAETEELFLLLEDPANQEPIIDLFLEGLQAEAEVELVRADWDPVVQTILTALPKEDSQPDRRAHGTVRMFRWAAAAAAVFILGVAGWILVTRTHKPAAPLTAEQRFKNDVQPGTNRPVLTLADGRTVVLDSAQSGALATEGTVKVKRLANGEIVYDASVPTKEVRYNTITNPKGSKVVSLTLADGSKVWLDAASSITYPTAFVGEERKVEVKGQAYFEITHVSRYSRGNTSPNPSRATDHPLQRGRASAQPFIVEMNGAQVRVLGTHFNVMAFEGEKEVQVTLLEGSVEVSQKSKVKSKNLPGGGLAQEKVRIQPGEQAVLSFDKSQDKGVLTIDHSPDIAQVMAWKEGVFRFEGATITSIMKQLERWYDVQVVYEDRPTDTFVSTIPRDVPASQVFKILETTGRVKFRIEGKRVVVMSPKS